jgi:hypothetical protein
MSWKRMEKIKVVRERIGAKRTLLNNILHRKPNWIGHILRTNCLLHDAIEGQMTEMKGVGRRKQLLDDLRNRRCWELKEEAEDRNRWKRQFINRTYRRKVLDCVSRYLHHYF